MPVIRTCAVGSFRKTLSNMFEQLAMVDSVPGPDIISLVGPVEGYPTPEAAAAIRRRPPTTGDAVCRGSESASRRSSLHTATTASDSRSRCDFYCPRSGGVRACFEKGILLKPDTLASAWQSASRSQMVSDCRTATAWFVQSYSGETVVWRYGIGEKVENRGEQLIVTDGDVAFAWVDADHPGEQQRVAKSLSLSDGDVSVSVDSRACSWDCSLSKYLCTSGPGVVASTLASGWFEYC